MGLSSFQIIQILKAEHVVNKLLISVNAKSEAWKIEKNLLEASSSSASQNLLAILYSLKYSGMYNIFHLYAGHNKEVGARQTYSCFYDTMVEEFSKQIFREMLQTIHLQFYLFFPQILLMNFGCNLGISIY